jgi:hypothetical protein
MKLSVQSLWQNALKTARRFPVMVADSLLVTLLALTHNWEYAKSDAYQRILLTAVLAFPLFLSLKLFAERWNWPAKTQSLVQLCGLLPLTVYYSTLTNLTASANGIRFMILLMSTLCLLSFAPYTVKGEINGYWRYNKSLIFGFAVAGLSAIALAGGISIALAGCDYLLGINVPNWVYEKLWLIASCFLWPCFFLATLPEDFEQLQSAEIIDKFLESFIRFIVIPLVLLYMIILYLYAGKIIIQATWPKGGVAGFILGFSWLGLLSILLLHPLRNNEGNQWIGSYVKWLSLSILPQTIMLFMSVWRRVSEYGITESRYFGIVSAFWLAGICLYFLLSRIKSIKAMAMSLCVVTFLSSFGPWGALSVSEQSQVGRLECLLKKNGILSDGKVVKAVTPVPLEDQGSISAIVKYLNDRHGLRPFKDWFTEDLNKVPAHDRAKKIVNLMGLTFAPYAASQKTGSERYYSFRAARSEFIKVAGYDYYLRIGPQIHEESCDDEGSIQNSEGTLGSKKVKAYLDAKEGRFFISRDKETIGSIDVMPLVRELREKYKDTLDSYNTVPQSDMVLEGNAGNVAVKLYFTEIHIKELNDTLELTNATGDSLLRVESDRRRR